MHTLPKLRHNQFDTLIPTAPGTVQELRSALFHEGIMTRRKEEGSSGKRWRGPKSPCNDDVLDTADKIAAVLGTYARDLHRKFYGDVALPNGFWVSGDRILGVHSYGLNAVYDVRDWLVENRVLVMGDPGSTRFLDEMSRLRVRAGLLIGWFRMEINGDGAMDVSSWLTEEQACWTVAKAKSTLRDWRLNHGLRTHGTGKDRLFDPDSLLEVAERRESAQRATRFGAA